MTQTLRERQDVDFDKNQFLFIIPMEWQGMKCEDYLRSLFFEANWIKKDEHRNRLIFSPFLDCYVNYLRNPKEKYYQRDLRRERKYLLYSMVPNTETEGIIFDFTCFQMQNAKELSAVSSKLAAGDLLLTPTVLHTKVIDLPSLGNLIKQIVSRNAEIEANKVITSAKTIINHKDGMHLKKKHLSNPRMRYKVMRHNIYKSNCYKTNETARVHDEKTISLAISYIIENLCNIRYILVSQLNFNSLFCLFNDFAREQRNIKIFL